MARTSLDAYRKKRDFTRSAEPPGRILEGAGGRFVVHEHHASRLHFDLRLEMGGVLKSWAVPKGPSLDPKMRRLAVQTEDHPVQYLDFQGAIADGQYGAGEVRIWDAGRYALSKGGNLLAAWEQGRLHVDFAGGKLKGAFMLMRTARDDRRWLLFKLKDADAVADWTPALILPYGSRAEKPGKPAAAAPAVTHPEKVYWPGEGRTKGDLIRYYDAVAPWLLPHLKDRPLILKRFPDGIGRPPFFQQDIKRPPPFLATAEIRGADGRVIQCALCQNRESLLYLANLGVIPLHAWLSRVPHLSRQDHVVFDLDPGDVPFDEVREQALFLGGLLESLGLEAFPKTSGSRGIHVYVPLRAGHAYAQGLGFARLVAEWAVRQRPGAFTIERSLKARGRGHIYLDYQQNAEGKGMAAVYSARERPGAPVSAALEWPELERRLDMADFNIDTMPGRLRRKGDLFAGTLRGGNSLAAATKRLKRLLAG